MHRPEVELKRFFSRRPSKPAAIALACLALVALASFSESAPEPRARVRAPRTSEGEILVRNPAVVTCLPATNELPQGITKLSVMIDDRNLGSVVVESDIGLALREITMGRFEVARKKIEVDIGAAPTEDVLFENANSRFTLQISHAHDGVERGYPSRLTQFSLVGIRDPLRKIASVTTDSLEIRTAVDFAVEFLKDHPELLCSGRIFD